MLDVDESIITTMLQNISSVALNQGLGFYPKP
jgi:hypothetical protein